MCQPIHMLKFASHARATPQPPARNARTSGNRHATLSASIVRPMTHRARKKKTAKKCIDASFPFGLEPILWILKASLRDGTIGHGIGDLAHEIHWKPGPSIKRWIGSRLPTEAGAQGGHVSRAPRAGARRATRANFDARARWRTWRFPW